MTAAAAGCLVLKNRIPGQCKDLGKTAGKR
jgi:hypothetical protein